VVGKNEPQGDEVLLALREVALQHADVEEGLACKGTVVQSATFTVRGKAFLFLRPGRAMMKLEASSAEAKKQAAKFPDRYKLGAGGWATVTYTTSKDVSLPMLRRWIAESYGLFAAAPKGRSPKT
jgi:hypothetical protein